MYSKNLKKFYGVKVCINVMVSWWKVTLHTIENSSTTNKGARVQSGDV